MKKEEEKEEKEEEEEEEEEEEKEEEARAVAVVIMPHDALFPKFSTPFISHSLSLSLFFGKVGGRVANSSEGHY